MKKIMKGVCLMGVLALLATSCQKKDNDSAVLKSTNEQMEVVAGEWNDGEKVQLNIDDNKLYFEEGDIMTLFRINADPTLSACADYTPALTQVDQTTWTPVGTELPEEGDLYAFCPGGDNYVVPNLANDNRATFKLPAEQYYRENTCPTEGFYMAAKLEEGQEHFQFRNICGILWLKIYNSNGPSVVQEIEVLDKGGKPLSGDVTLKIDKVDPDILTSLYRNYNPDNASYVSTLNDYIVESGYHVENQGGLKLVCPEEGVQIGSTKAAATNFFITLRPLALRKGVDIKITLADGTVYTKSTTKSNIIGPNVLKKMPVFNIAQ